MRRYTSSSRARRSVTYAISAPPSTSARTSSGFVRSGSVEATMIEPFSNLASRTPATALTRARSSGRGAGRSRISVARP